MDNDFEVRLEKIEKSQSEKRKDIWEKLPAITGLLIPISIACIGWYYTNENTKSQLEVQRLNNENQFQVALVNSSVGQSELIKDFMQHLTSKDTATRNIAIEAILYAAPTPGKKIVDVLSRTSDKQTRMIAIDALDTKRLDLVSNLFSDQKQMRLIAANEITASWSSDQQLLKALLDRTSNCVSNSEVSLNCSDGVYNAFSILPSFSRQLIMQNKEAILSIAAKVPDSNSKTKKLANTVIAQL